MTRVGTDRSATLDSPSAPSTIRRWLRSGAVAITNLFVAGLWLVTLAWLIGRAFTDRFEWSQWLWWIPTPAILVVALAGFTLAFRSARTSSRRRRRIVVWGVVLMCMAGYFVGVEHRFLRSASPAAAAAGITVAHWNMTLDNRSNNELLVRHVQDLASDITALTNPSGEVRRLLNEESARSTPEARWFTFDAWPVFLRTRFPVMRVHTLVATDGVFVTAVTLDSTPAIGRPLTLYTVDLPSNPRRARMPIARFARGILDRANPPTPDIVVGDFNITRGSASIAALFPGFGFAFDQGGHGYGASFPRRWPLYHIDHILIDADAGWRCIRYDLLDEGASRHLTQKAWLTFQ